MCSDRHRPIACGLRPPRATRARAGARRAGDRQLSDGTFFRPPKQAAYTCCYQRHPEHGTNALFATPLCIGNRPSVPRWRAGQP
ncbi:hypothetical protein CHLRE_17g703976v5 [Chlamydomonas reinhardtii]|uniref:Uncharacterized protein n=1 Tax=Chlamydomonas reinhardtii TaxID=3055 RepID=A0A2K3CP53_CHLRE|nr:uncharacterized protein CHLRE_17g703976v5 [Chlamydomonas reinhardtii]PNW70060.1 hypothetical protein CHLRE_17g703976v5 [Chlamydomonas reinhardtii]